MHGALGFKTKVKFHSFSETILAFSAALILTFMCHAIQLSTGKNAQIWYDFLGVSVLWVNWVNSSAGKMR
jgi:hypothetical protein